MQRISLTQYLVEKQRQHGHIPGQLRLLIEVVARAHSEAEEADLRRLGASRVVIAERELGNELIRHALRRFGVSDREVAAILESRRRA